jgi:hypothetical protein
MAPSDNIAHVEHERRLGRLIRRLPGKMQAITRWLRRPASRWARIPAGVLPPAGRRRSAAAPGARAGARLGRAAAAALVRRRPNAAAGAARGTKNRAIRRSRQPPAAIDFMPFLTHL